MCYWFLKVAFYFPSFESLIAYLHNSPFKFLINEAHLENQLGTSQVILMHLDVVAFGCCGYHDF